LDPSVIANVELRQKSGKLSIKGLLGDKAIASAQLSLAPLWKDLFARPEGITEMRDLVGPKVDAGFETINAPARSTDKSRITISLRYEKLRDIPAPLAQIEKIPKGVIRVRSPKSKNFPKTCLTWLLSFLQHRVFSSPLYYKHNSSGMKDHTLNLHSARIAAEMWANGPNSSVLFVFSPTLLLTHSFSCRLRN